MISRTKAIILIALLLAMSAGVAQAKVLSSKATLNQYISQLRTVSTAPQSDENMDEAYNLREKIITLALKMDPPPKVPDSVYECTGRAASAVKNAKTAADYAEAVKAFQEALLIAPWVADNYYNLATVQEKAGMLDEAIESWNWYLMAAPQADDAKTVRIRMGDLKYRAEKARKAAAANRDLIDYAFIGKPEKVIEALDNGADINAQSAIHTDGDTALMLAIIGQKVGKTEPSETVKLLVDRGADLNARDKKGKTALMHAVVQMVDCGQNSPGVQYLIDKGADVNAQDNDGKSVLMYAAVWGANSGIVNQLIENGADVNATDDNFKAVHKSVSPAQNYQE